MLCDLIFLQDEYLFDLPEDRLDSSLDRGHLGFNESKHQWLSTRLDAASWGCGHGYRRGRNLCSVASGCRHLRSLL